MLNSGDNGLTKGLFVWNINARHQWWCECLTTEGGRMKRILLVVLFLFAPVAFGQSSKQVPTGPIVAIEAIVCFSENVAIDVATAFVSKSAEEARIILRGYMDK